MGKISKERINRKRNTDSNMYGNIFDFTNYRIAIKTEGTIVLPSRLAEFQKFSITFCWQGMGN